MKTLKILLSILLAAGVLLTSCDQNESITGLNQDTDHTDISAKRALSTSTTVDLSDWASVVSDYPMSVSFDVAYHKQHKEYMNDGATLKNGSILSLPYASLTPPPGYRIGETVTIDFTADTLNGEMVYSFGPSGCQFDPPLKVVMNYKDLVGEGDAKLYYIADDGHYIEQQPDEADLFGKWMTIYVNHFSRYAVAYAR